MVSVRSVNKVTFTEWGARRQPGQPLCRMLCTTFDHVRARLALHVHDDGGRAWFIHAAFCLFSVASTTLRDVAEPMGAPLLIGDDDWLVAQAGCSNWSFAPMV